MNQTHQLSLSFAFQQTLKYFTLKKNMLCIQSFHCQQCIIIFIIIAVIIVVASVNVAFIFISTTHLHILKTGEVQPMSTVQSPQNSHGSEHLHVDGHCDPTGKWKMASSLWGDQHTFSDSLSQKCCKVFQGKSDRHSCVKTVKAREVQTHVHL